MGADGTQVQTQIYAAGAAEWPIAPEEWEARAAQTLERGPFDYIAGGAGGESTMRANLAAFERRRLRPRMLARNAVRELAVEVLGTPSAAPLLLAPIGVLGIAHPEGELAAARAAAASGIPFVVSTAASHTLEEIAAAMGDAPRWYQLYWSRDRELVGSWLDRAAAAGYRAVVVTVDTPYLGWRERDLRNAYLPFLGGEGLAQYFSDPFFRSRLDAPPEEDVFAASVTALGLFANLELTWDDLAWVRDRTGLSVLVKGVLTAEDALRARDCGVDGIVVSNHGGRQVDGAVASLDALVEVRDALGGDATVLVDGGIRRGSDVVKALALGADAVLLGRPYAYGLAAGGQAGVEAVIRHLVADLDLTLALVGSRSVQDLDRSYVDG